jgi:NhaP-type Na+/H+ or K+/H+ antiporter
LSTNQLLLGLGLVIVLALGCELVATRTRLPAIVLLLPVGFIAGAITDDVHPSVLFGATFQPIVSLAVGLILFEAGLRLRFDELRRGVRTVVIRLISVGMLATAGGVTLAVKLLFGLAWGSSLVLGAILVVSGPTVVMPLLEFVRPPDRVRSALKWEGVLIDPLGALLGVVAFTAVKAGGKQGFHFGELLASLGVGLMIGALAAGALWLLLVSIQRAGPRQSIAAALLTVTAAVVAADLIREDAGFVAASTMGVILANQERLDVSRVLEFQGPVVELLIGVLFVLISASVQPSTVGALLPDGIALIAIMVIVIRPLVVAWATRRSSLDRPERAFMAWLAPRGIVAAATASAFGPTLAQDGIAGASKILPIAFIAIFGTVVVYGLSAAPLARRLHLIGASSIKVLIVGGHNWARAIASTLQAAGLAVRLWTGEADEQAAARAEGLEAGNARLGVDLATREAELEDVTDALLLTASDNFNALAAFELRQELGHDHVYRLAAGGSLLDLVPRYAEGNVLFGSELTFAELSRRFDAGAELVIGHSTAQPGMTLLFVVSPAGRLRVVTPTFAGHAGTRDTPIWLADSPAGAVRTLANERFRLGV